MKHETDLWALVIGALWLEKHEYEYGRKQKPKSRVRSVCVSSGDSPAPLQQEE
jgi:hypothetical protein